MCFQSSASSPQAADRIWCRCTHSLLPESRFKFPPYHGDRIFRDYAWLHWCPGLTLRRWQEECRLVEDRFSLFRSFAEAPFFGFRGIVSRSASIYEVTVAAEMDLYPKYRPWVFVTPTILGAREDGKLCVDVNWRRDLTFAEVIGALIAYIDGTCRESDT